LESRRVILLTKGFLHGWLDFKDKTKLSRARENYIINWIESEEVKEIARVRTMVDATIAAGIKSPEVIRLAFDSYDRYRELALPYVAKKASIDLGSNKQQMVEKLKAFKEKNKGAFERLKEQRAKKDVNGPVQPEQLQ
jgi:hypothetical protein